MGSLIAGRVATRTRPVRRTAILALLVMLLSGSSQLFADAPTPQRRSGFLTSLSRRESNFSVLVAQRPATALPTTGGEEETDRSQDPKLQRTTRKLAGGSLDIYRISQADNAARHLIIHFHGAPETVAGLFSRSRFADEATLAVVNSPGLSSAYTDPIAADPTLFGTILKLAEEPSRTAAPDGVSPWQRVSVSSFSAGYGAIRELLKTPAHFDRIDEIAVADSIYAGLTPNHQQREVNPDHMKGFARFASLAADGNKAFIVTHSSQPTPYASTTETADFLLEQVGLTRTRVSIDRGNGWHQTSIARRGRFIVMGFDGDSGKDHMKHLFRLDLLWNHWSNETDPR